MTRIHKLVVVVIAFASAGLPAYGQIEVGPHGGVNFDGTEVILGAQVRFPVGVEIAGLPVIARPSLDFYPFIDSGFDGGILDDDDFDFSLWVLNLDAQVPLDLSDSFDAYLGAGLYLARSSVSYSVSGATLDDSETDGGLNLLAGAKLGDPDANFRPFVETILALGDGSSGLIVKGGILLQVGGD